MTLPEARQEKPLPHPEERYRTSSKFCPISPSQQGSPAQQHPIDYRLVEHIYRQGLPAQGTQGRTPERVRIQPLHRPGQQTARIQEIHALLTEHLDRRYTIEELSHRYLLNTSTLKEVFKAVYGLPIATYMKEYRVRRAMELLRESGGSIAAIAAAVGYESQGKFTRAFKDVTGQLPTEYRREHRG